MVPLRHVLQQGPVVAALARGAASSFRRSPRETVAPGPWHHALVPPRPRDLIDDYVRHVGGDVASYRGLVPPHLFPQWIFPLQARALEGVSYPLQKVLNGGCRMEVRAPLPADRPLEVATRLDSVDDDGRRAVLRFLATTGPKDEPEALVVHLNAVVPLGGPSESKPRKERVRVPSEARELARWRLGPRAGLEFAILTGDFNPVHWVAPYARAFGFRNTILHGFSSFARVYESLRVARRIAPRVLDVRFTRPLVLPARVGLFTADASLFVGDAAGAPAYLTGTFEGP
ncbi:MAG: MaoC family dehydratase [Sandaracinus sp.]|nr:MaoC family dehydratase [Sandaracinus sp.]MCB9620417.1 MaoC family dehydratase [Sandaracinus sp.]